MRFNWFFMYVHYDYKFVINPAYLAKLSQQRSIISVLTTFMLNRYSSVINASRQHLSAHDHSLKWARIFIRLTLAFTIRCSCGMAVITSSFKYKQSQKTAILVCPLVSNVNFSTHHGLITRFIITGKTTTGLCSISDMMNLTDHEYTIGQSRLIITLQQKYFSPEMQLIKYMICF